MANLAFAQQEVVQDFESSPEIAGFEGLESATIVPDPSTAGNGQVFELVTSVDGNPWQGAEVILADNSVLDLTSDLTVSIDVWSDVAFSPMAKVETTGSADAAPSSANTQSHTGNGWETLTFTFNTGDDNTATADGIYNKVVFFPNRTADGAAWNTPEDGTFYFDNITGEKGSIGTTPAGQEVVQDFESSPDFAGFEGLESAAIVPDPETSGNGQVFELVTSADGNPWQGAEVVLADDSALELTSDLTVSVDVWSDVAFSPMAKVETTEPADAAPFSANTQSHTGNGWETLTFTFNTGDDGTATADGLYNKVVFFPNRSADGADWNTPEDGTFYFDNITGVKGSIDPIVEEIAAPATAAPAQPLRDAADVISIFSNAYDDITVDTFSAGFDDSSIEDVTIAGNPTKLIDFTNFIGVDFQSNKQDASEMTHFHIDFWTETEDLVGKVFNSKFSQWGGTDAEVSAFELNINDGTSPAIESGTWVTIDVPISDWTGDVTRDDIAQFLITSNLDKVYVDNIYLYREGTTTQPTVDAFSLLSPPNGTDLDLTGDGSAEAVIEWEEATSNTDVTYTWHVDATGGDFSDPLVSIASDNSGSATTLTLPFSAVDATLASLGVGEGESITVDWTVTAMGADVIQFADQVYSITLTRNLSVSNELDESPNKFALNQNYPNPFNPTTSITYNLPASGEVTLEVFNVTGQRVATLVNGVKSAGSHIATFDASNLSSGVYMYRLSSGNSVQIRKMLLIK